MAYDSGTGAQLWVARYGQPAKEAAYGVSVAVSPDSSKVFVTGDTGNDGGYRGLQLLKETAMKRTAGLAALAVITVAGFAPATALSPQRALASAARASASASVPGGTQLWAASYHGNAQRNHAVAAAASPDGATVFVTGLTGLAHFSTVAYNAATGTTPLGCRVLRPRLQPAERHGGQPGRIEGIRDRIHDARAARVPRPVRHGRLRRGHRDPALGGADLLVSTSAAWPPRLRSARTGPRCSSPGTPARIPCWWPTTPRPARSVGCPAIRSPWAQPGPRRESRSAPTGRWRSSPARSRSLRPAQIRDRRLQRRHRRTTLGADHQRQHRRP